MRYPEGKYLAHYVLHPEDLTESQRYVLRELIDLGEIRYDRHISHCWYGDYETGGPLTANKMLAVYICHIRKYLFPWWKIKNIFGKGYRLVYQARKVA